MTAPPDSHEVAQTIENTPGVKNYKVWRDVARSRIRRGGHASPVLSVYAPIGYAAARKGPRPFGNTNDGWLQCLGGNGRNGLVAQPGDEDGIM